ncbi:sensor histidine kinase [Streptomyces sp. M41]|uniref:sensor histidine kinase n=1 Tax=Streptomyces sp. M41 TaxID=3059412 RepID=UPI00374DB3D9
MPRKPHIPRRLHLSSVSLRWKIAALAALAAFAVALTVGILVHTRSYARVKDIRREEAFLVIEDCARPAKIHAEVCSRATTIDPPDMPPQLRRAALATSGTVTAYDGRDSEGLGPWMWAAQSVDGKIVTHQVVMNPDYRALVSLDKYMAAASLVALAGVVPLCALAAGILSRRLRKVSTTAARLSAGELDARNGPVRGRDEVFTIATTVDAMADHLVRRLETERQFTADVAHELRTPVAGLLAATDLLAPGDTENLIRNRIRDLRDLIEDLLEISRLDAGNENVEHHRVPVHMVVADAVARTGLDTTVTHTNDTWTETDPRRLERVVTNLIVNAHRHGRRPVEVHTDSTTITIRDHGPGYPDDLLREGPRRFRTGARDRGSGHGLGLTIAQAQARVLGAQLTFTNAYAGGAQATLRLPGQTSLPNSEHE